MSDETRGTYYFLTDRPATVDLLANPPFETGKDYEPACGTGAFLVYAAETAGKEAK
jgi:type I restriction-modification system DNA methylase subunit